MVKKVVDILPPQKQPKITIKSKRLLFERKVKSQEPLKIEEGNKKNRLLYLLLLPIFLASVFLIGFLMAKVQVKIWPETESLTVKTQFTVNTAMLGLDTTKKVLPGEIKEVLKTVSDVFAATGESSEKAQGVIRLYNSYTTKTETWLAGTRFVSEGGIKEKTGR